MAREIVGREEELSSLYAVVERAADGPAALVLEGEAGIGKSTLWRMGVDAARARGSRVLLSQPAEVERDLAHAGLGDLFEDTLESVLPALSAPRRRALEVALLVEDAVHGSDPRTLGVAVRSALDVLAAQIPVVLAVDDLQWLDPSSASALAFALRRMREQPILLLLARRVGAGAEPTDTAATAGTRAQAITRRTGGGRPREGRCSVLHPTRTSGTQRSGSASSTPGWTTASSIVPPATSSARR